MDKPNILIIGSSGRIGLCLAQKLDGKILRCDITGYYDYYMDVNEEGSIEPCSYSYCFNNNIIDCVVDCSYPRNHLDSASRIVYKFSRYMKSRDIHGSIILFSSIYGFTTIENDIYKDTNVNPPLDEYIGEKAGIIQIVKHYAKLYGKHGIRINCISPGGIYDNQDSTFVERYCSQTPLGRMCHPDDIVGIVNLLCSPAGSYITGQNIVIDGGFSL